MTFDLSDVLAAVLASEDGDPSLDEGSFLDVPPAVGFFLGVGYSEGESLARQEVCRGLGVAKLERIYAPMQVLEPSQHSEILLVSTELVADNLAVIAATGEEVAVAHGGRGENPGVVLVNALKRVSRLLLVHDPQVDCVVVRTRQVELTRQHLQRVYRVHPVHVEEL